MSESKKQSETVSDQDQLAEQELEQVAGGFNPQPDPPGDAQTRTTTTATTSSPITSPLTNVGALAHNHNQTLKAVRR